MVRPFQLNDGGPEMTLNVRKWTFELTRTHAYFRALGWEGLWDFSGQVGSSLNRT